MYFPSLVPENLHAYKSSLSEEELYNRLVKNTTDLISFFDVASDDETWADEHSNFMRKLLEWLTNEDFNERLTREQNNTISRVIWRHYSVLGPLLPQNIEIKLKDAVTMVNSLLLVHVSDFFLHHIRECRKTDKMSFLLSYVSEEVFSPIREYISSGAIVNLWRKGQEDLLILLKQANAWRVDGVAELCERSLFKYLDQNNVLQMLEMSIVEHWPILKMGCINYINKNFVGFQLSETSIERLAFKFENFTDETLDFFKRVQHLVTDLIFSGTLTENPTFGYVVRQCPKLRLLDLSTTARYSNYFSEIPSSIQSLILAQCQWVSHESLRQFSVYCPNIEELSFANNIQMNFTDWGELLKFKLLKKLDLSRCHNIRDEDLAIILKACGSLTELNLDDCHRIGEGGFFEIAKKSPRLLVLNLSRTNISDAPFVDIALRCRSLHTLIVSRCEQLSEKSVVSVIRYGKGLRVLDLTRCQLPRGFLEEIRASNPNLQIIY